MSEIEPGFPALVPVCMELPVASGYVDNLYVTEDGNLAIAECKLWRNPQARREVVAQIIDYAHAMARWSYSDLEAAIHLGVRPTGEKVGGVTLYSLLSEAGELDESRFVDAVSRNLRLGRLLLLIIGDGIREGVETLADYLQIHAGFHFALGIVEMPIFALPSGYVVQPRVLARTVNIERGIVRLTDGVHVEPIEVSSTKSVAGQRTSIPEAQLREQLNLVPALLPALDQFLEQAEHLGVYAEPATKSLQIRWRGPDDEVYALGGIDEKGNFLTNSVNWKPHVIGQVSLAHRYLEGIAKLLGGKVRRTPQPNSWYVVRDDKKRSYDESLPQAITLLSKSDQWLDTIRSYTAELSAAIEEQTN